MDYLTGLLALANGGTLYFMDGIYELNSITLGKDGFTGTYQAATGTRPVIVGVDGYPPAVYARNDTTVSGLWFGGTKPAAVSGSRGVQSSKRSTWQDCTFFGYYGGIINGSDQHANIYRRNRFVNCGSGLYYHPIYVANLNSSQESDGVLTEECIAVGCEGYSFHYYHEPSYGLAQYNLMCDAKYGLALQGDEGGPVSGNRNILWTASDAPLYDICSLGTCDHNVWRGCSKPLAGGSGTFDTNYFVDPVPTSGTNPVVWGEEDIVANFGDSSSNIDAAVSALEASFAESVATIQADATIETNFAVLKAVIDTWKTK